MADVDGMALACKHCRYRFPEDVTVGVAAAHFEVEHGSPDVEFELVVVCSRCGGEMSFERSVGNKDRFTCEPCHRTRVITRNPEAGRG